MNLSPRLDLRPALPASLVVCTGALVAAVQVSEPRFTTVLIALPLAAGALLLLARRPLLALVSMLVYIPVQRPLLSWLYAAGAPVPVVRYLGYWKELVVAALVLAAVAHHQKAPRPASALDALALAYLALASVLLVVPAALPGVLGNQPFSVLVAAYRLNTLFVVSFLACRRLDWTERDLEALGRWVLVPALAMSVAVIWQAQDKAGFERFSLKTLQLQSYLRDVNGVTDKETLSTVFNRVTDTGSIRAGGWFYDPLSLGFFMVLPVTIAFLNLARRRATPLTWAIAGLVSVTLVLTLTRSSVVAAVLSLVLLLLAAARYRLRERTRLVLTALLVAVCVAPFVGQSSVAARIQSAVNGTDLSATEHASSSSAALGQLIAHPAGRGLGSNPVTATLDRTRTGLTSENAYLQVGNELGLLALVLFVLLVLGIQAALLAALRRQHRLGVVAAVWAAGWGLAFNGLFLHVWLSIPVALTFWSLAGAASTLGDRRE